ncbi:MAG: hypothetical protein FWH35_05625 [Treponema sp.]|nr:hypothetical protein [Treponema sp.]
MFLIIVLIIFGFCLVGNKFLERLIGVLAGIVIGTIIAVVIIVTIIWAIIKYY